MQKIKFKTEYKPLPDEVINRHKNFDALLAVYAVAPKINFFQKFLKNKWTMFSGGIIIGTVATLLLTLNKSDNNKFSEYQNTNQTEINNSNTITQSELINSNTASQVENNKNISTVEIHEQKINSETSSNASFKQSKNNSEYKYSTTANKNSNSVNNQMENTFTDNSNTKEENSKPEKNPQGVKTSEIDNTIPADFVNYNELNKEMVSKEETLDSTFVLTGEKNIAIQKPELNPLDTIEPIGNSEIKSSNADAINSDKQPISEAVCEKVRNPKSKDKKEINSTEISTDLSDKNEFKTNSNITKSDVESTPDSTQSLFSEITFLDKFFEKRISKNDTVLKNSVDAKQTLSHRLNDTTYIDCYAQLSFFTPLGTNGLDSYKYKHHLSINVIQGLNGAVEGVEFGGVANLIKGYVKGGQFAGVTNLAAGKITGVQAAGILNVGRSLYGGQFAGVANVSIFGVTGMQAAGVLNISSSIKDSSVFFQTAGVANVSLSNNATGVQAAGVLNLANDIKGGQIGLVNVAKTVTGFQIGLVNIADTIDGVSIGLLSFSRNGIFDVDVFTSDLFQTNIGLRVGSKYIYNIFAFGVSPFSDTLRYGFGLGIGGHIPAYKNISVDIDAMAWNTFEDKFDFNYNQFHMLNQLRITPSYTFANNKISVYAGPAINVEVYENGVDPLKENTFREFSRNGFTTALSLGYVIGVRFF